MEKIKLTDNNFNTKQPSNLEAEQALLGSILVNNDIIDEVSTIITFNKFYDPLHKKIYETIENLNNKDLKLLPIQPEGDELALAIIFLLNSLQTIIA